MMTVDEICNALKLKIETQISDAVAVITPGSGGHYRVDVQSISLAALPMLKAHQAVYASIADLMAGDAAPVHAIDHLSVHA